jgi:hypothetical protein
VEFFSVLTLPSLASRKVPWRVEAGDIRGKAVWAPLGLVDCMLRRRLVSASRGATTCCARLL